MSVFSKIIRREIPADIVFENERFIAIKDIAPKAPVHLLIIYKKEVPDLQSLDHEDRALFGEVIEIAQKLAAEFGIEDGYRFITNNGPDAGQMVFHIHFHLIGGKPLGDLA